MPAGRHRARAFLASDVAARRTPPDTPGTYTERLTDVFPWMSALSPQGREDCARDVLELSASQPHLAMSELTSWRETATALAVGMGNEPVHWLEADEPVERP